MATADSGPAGKPDSIEPFLEAVRSDRDRELGLVENAVREEIARLKSDAWRRSFELFINQSGRVRQQQALERDRGLSRVRARVRRRRWALIRELQDDALWAIFEAMRSNWKIPERQLAWCSHWLARAQQHAGGSAIQVRLGGGASADTVASLERQLGSSGGGRVLVDERQAPGCICEWGDVQLDGSLEAQRPRLAAQVFEELTRWLHEIEGDSGERNESR